ncbi:MarR family winged helix-turn-helix transcriptional regulator [Streptomyces sp. UNOC14_S4]|uniref:MarR family winged helix-turn-helix transcriptional regulator n=1 Tax=Streptomyces sp. UNOC14_S4 TaxID=2872340 RepID=UPI001E53C680|nr:MarR family winged helix-turn-helix transcriptional regulator [Streptomyces sp. UNOC14_S4]MCC3768736.1 MarR family winged helix-turn-helix transcriptional regulator [Streptomyces sp. UNOC14_S4]
MTNGTAATDRPIAYVAWHAAKAILRHSQSALAAIDLTQPQWWALNNIAQAEHGLTRGEIRARPVPYDMGPEAMAHAADALAHRGWLSTDTDADGRLTLTERGRAGLATAKEHMARVRADLLGDITDEEYATAVSVLQRVTDNLA